MSNRSQLLLGGLGVICLALIVVGSSALALVESGISVAALPEQVMAELEFNPPVVPVTPLVGKLLRPTQREVVSTEVAGLVEPIPEETGSRTECLVPADWVIYVIQQDDDLEAIASRFGVSLETLIRYNCLQVKSLVAGSTLFVPGGGDEQVVVRSPEKEEREKNANHPRKQKDEKCRPPSWWVGYRIQAGDTLYALGIQVGASVRELQKANCMGTATLLRVGQILYVPAVPIAYNDPPASSTGQRRQPKPSPLPPTIDPTPPRATPYPTWVASPTPLPTDPNPPTLPPSETVPPSPTAISSPPPVTDEPPAPTEETRPPAPTQETQPPAPTEETQPPAPTEETQPPAPPIETQPPAPPIETQPPAPTEETKPPAPPEETQPPDPPRETQPPGATEEPGPPPPDEPSPPAQTQESQPGTNDAQPGSETGRAPSLHFVRDLPGAYANDPLTAKNELAFSRGSVQKIDPFTIWHNQWYYGLLMLVIILVLRRL